MVSVILNCRFFFIAIAALITTLRLNYLKSPLGIKILKYISKNGVPKVAFGPIHESSHVMIMFIEIRSSQRYLHINELIYSSNIYIYA